MANVTITNNAAAVRDIRTYTPTVANNTDYELTIAGKTVSYTSDASASAQEIVEGLYALLTSTDNPPPAEFLDATWSENDAILTMTGNVAGRPIGITCNVQLTEAVVSTATGPSDAANVANYSTGALPSAADNLTYSNTAIPLLYNLDALAGIALTKFTIENLRPGAAIGLPYVSTTGGYNEYRRRAIKIDAATIEINDINASTINLEVDRASSTASLSISRAPNGNGVVGAVQLTGPDIGNIEVGTGSVDICRYAQETAAFTNLLNVSGNVFVGETASAFTSITNVSGTVETHVSTTGNVTLDGGEVVTRKAAALPGTTTIRSGTLTHLSSGTITNCQLGSLAGGLLETNGDLSSFTITALNILPGGQFNRNISRSITVGTLTMASTVSQLSAA